MSNQEWIEHTGGPCPVAADARVDIRMTSYVSKDVRAESCEWGHGIDGCDDIIAYRLVSPPAEAGCAASKEACENHRCENCGREWVIEPARLARDMTVRERMVMAAMQGMCAWSGSQETDYKWFVGVDSDLASDARHCVKIADALLAVLEASGDE